MTKLFALSGALFLLAGCVEEERPAWGAGVYPPAANTSVAPWEQVYAEPQVTVPYDQIERLRERQAQDAALWAQREANQIARRQARALEEQNVILRESDEARQDRYETRD